MEWALAILFSAAVLLLILSYVKARQTSKTEQREIELFSITFMEEINQLQKQIRNLELDLEIITKEAGLQIGSSKEELLQLREILDLFKRGYSFQSIADEKRLTVGEIECILTPYAKVIGERSEVTNAEREVN